MDARRITKKSKSNLALAFVALDRKRRRDITTFYAFCRLIDDIADSEELTKAEKARQLQRWRQSLLGPAPDEPEIAPDLRELMTRYSIAPPMVEEIIAGVEMDLEVARYPTWSDLRVYCYRVASAVGLVSIEIFGYQNPRCRDYAIELGLALQTTNIIRDVGKDLQSGRIYLPQEDLERFRYSEEELRARVYNQRFIDLMRFQAARSKQFFTRARQLLPREDRRSMVAAEIMRSTYFALLKQIEEGDFRVFDRVHSLSRPAKLFHISRHLLGIG